MNEWVNKINYCTLEVQKFDVPLFPPSPPKSPVMDNIYTQTILQAEQQY